MCGGSKQRREVSTELLHRGELSPGRLEDLVTTLRYVKKNVAVRTGGYLTAIFADRSVSGTSRLK